MDIYSAPTYKNTTNAAWFLSLVSNTNSRLNILFWCQSLGIIEQSAPFYTLLHFAQTFNHHTVRKKFGRRGGIHNNLSSDSSLEGPEYNASSRQVVLSVKGYHSAFALMEESVFSHRQELRLLLLIT